MKGYTKIVRKFKNYTRNYKIACKEEKENEEEELVLSVCEKLSRNR